MHAYQMKHQIKAINKTVFQATGTILSPPELLLGSCSGCFAPLFGPGPPSLRSVSKTGPSDDIGRPWRVGYYHGESVCHGRHKDVNTEMPRRDHRAALTSCRRSAPLSSEFVTCRPISGSKTFRVNDRLHQSRNSRTRSTRILPAVRIHERAAQAVCAWEKRRCCANGAMALQSNPLTFFCSYQAVPLRCVRLLSKAWIRLRQQRTWVKGGDPSAW